MALSDWISQSGFRAGERISKRCGIKGCNLLNRRKNAKVEKLQQWITYYKNKVAKGHYCPIRAAKIIARFEQALAKKSLD